MKLQLVVAVLTAALGLGCAANRHQVKLEVDSGETILHVAEGGGQPIQIPEAELWGSFREAGRHVAAQADPLAAAEQAFGLTEQSGSYRYYGRSGQLVAEHLGGGLAEADAPIDRITEGYLEWCGGTKLGGGDCLHLLAHSRVLTPHGRYVVTLIMSMVRSVEPMLRSLGWLADPVAVAVTLGSAAAMYLTLWLLPEPMSKIVATTLTVFLIGYLGLDLVFSIRDGWQALTRAADQAQTFGDLRLAALDFGRVLGPQAGQVLLLLVSHSLGKGLSTDGASLPRFPQAAGQAASLLRVNLGLAAGVRAVAIGAGVVTIALATPAMAMTAAKGGGSRVRVLPAEKWDPPEGGPGRWTQEDEAMSDAAREYQSQVSGAPKGWVYKIGDVSFDGYKNGVLLEVKDRYQQFLTKELPAGSKPFFNGFEDFLEQARRQSKAAGGTPIEWHFSEKKMADFVRQLFEEKGLRSIRVVHTARAP